MTPEDSIVRTFAVALAQNLMIFVGYLLIKSVGPSLLFGLQWSKEVVDNKVGLCKRGHPCFHFKFFLDVGSVEIASLRFYFTLL